MIYPYFIEERIHAEDVKAVPIGLYSVAAVLKERGYDVEVLNWHDADKRPDEIEKTLLDERPDVIGFSILHANRWGGIEIARVAGRLHAGTKIVFGGVGATFLWEHLLTHFPEIDVVVLGEGERP
ncbi:MAG: cobalamin B12-binding domain-containing protein, partial [Pseudomonadota bacterium]